MRLTAARLIANVRRKGSPEGGEPAPQRDGPEAVAASLALGYPWRRLTIGLGLVMLVAVLAAGVGSVGMPPLTVMKILVSRIPSVDLAPTWPESWDTILWQLRFPRIALAGIVGGALALAGATYQGLFRNPLADPMLIGGASGAGLGATIVLVTGVPYLFHGVSLLPAVAFVGALAAVTVAYVIARNSEGLPLATLILAGVAITSLTGAAGRRSDDPQRSGPSPGP